MTLWSPVWRITIESVVYTNYTLANLTIKSGRTNIYEQAQAGYVNLQLINLDQSTVTLNINDSVTIELQDSTATFVPIFGGTITEFGIEISQTGTSIIAQTISIVALGALARLPKALTEGALTSAHDGDQIYEVLKGLLASTWSSVPPAITWATYDPTVTWATAEQADIGEIDRPGNYDLAARSSSRTDVYSLVSALATSGLGYIYENSLGQISYADSTHRTTYLSTYGYTYLDATQALSNGMAVQTRSGDIRNSIVLKYGVTSSLETTPFEDATSIATYGLLAQIISTTLKNHPDADDQAAFYLTLRAYPQANFEQISFQLASPELDDGDRDSLINIFMGVPLSISNLPLNMNSGEFLGFVEGWTFRAAYNEVTITANLSPLAFSLQAMRWDDVSVLEHWNTVSGTLDWQNATQVA